MNKSLVCVIFVVFCIVSPFSVLLAQAPLKPEDDELLGIIPSDALLVLRVNEFEYTLTQLDQFLAGTSPLGLSMLVRMQLAGFLGDPALNNVNMKESFAVFAVENPNATAENPTVPPVALMGCIPITGFDEFVRQNPSCGKPDKNGIATITTKDMMGNEKQMLITNIGSYGLVCTKDCYEVLSNFRRQFDVQSGDGVKLVPLIKVLEDIEAQRAVDKPVWLFMHLPEVSDTFISSASQQFNMMKMMMQQQQIEPSQAVLPDFDLIGILKSFQFISCTLAPTPTYCIIETTISSEPDSMLAGWFDPEGEAIQQMLQFFNAHSPDEDPKQLQQISTFLSDAQEMDFVGQYNLLSLLQFAALTLPQATEVNLTAKSSLFYGIGFSENVMNIRIAVPKEHLNEFVVASMALQPQLAEMRTMSPEDINVPEAPIDKPQPIQPTPTSEPVISIDGLDLGMTEAQMMEILGPPKSSTGNVYYYFDSGLTIVTSTRGFVEQIICGSVNPDSPLVKSCHCRTKEDIGIGSTREDLLEAYGQPPSVVNNPLQENAVTIEFQSINARFTLVGDKVVQMIFRAQRN